MSLTPPLRCLISHGSHQRSQAKALTLLLEQLGIETFETSGIEPGRKIASAIEGVIGSADFICLLVDQDTSTASMFFEAGLASGLGKPVLVLLENAELPFDPPRNILSVRYGPGQLQSVLPDIRRFVRRLHRSDPPPVQHGPDGESASRAAAELGRARGSGPAERSSAIVQVVIQLFKGPGVEVLVEPDAGTDRADLLLWSDQLVEELGGPVVIECKYYGGGSGSVLVNAKHTLDRIDKYVRESSASLALLVFDHDRPSDLRLTEYETPQALAFFIEDLIALVEAGKFVDELWRRRARAIRQQELRGDAD